VITPDELVMWAARELGFTDVRRLRPGERTSLGRARIATTASVSPHEWGAMVATDDGVVWNQVDTVLRDEEHVRAVTADGLAAVSADRVNLALVRWQPMHEIAAQLGDRIAFPYDAYALLLAQIEAVGADAIVPSACGGSHTEAFGWLDHVLYPVSPARFLADFARYSPDRDAFPAVVGGRLSLQAHAVTFDPGGGRDLVTQVDLEPDPRTYRPLEVPPLRDPNPNSHDEGLTRPRNRHFVTEELPASLARAYPGFDVDAQLRFVVEIVYPSGTETTTIVVDRDGATTRPGFDPEWDALDAVAGSLLWEVLEGRRSWGDVLLAGALRAFTRAYTPFNGRLRSAPVARTFLYYALSYDESVRRAVAWEVARAKG
jgi:hypothetical protein